MPRAEAKVAGHVVAVMGMAAVGCLAAETIMLEALVPVIELSGQDIALCGVRGTVTLPEGRVAIEVAIRKLDGPAEGTEFRVSAKLVGKVGNGPAGLSVRTATSGTTADFAAQPDYPGGVTLTGQLPPTEGAMFMQQLMVSGARAMLTYKGSAKPVEVTIPGPAPQSVRAAYLNCAGDLFRP